MTAQPKKSSIPLRVPDQIDARLLVFVWKHSRFDQTWILIVTLIGFPLLYLSLELPKLIINQGIQGKDVPADVFGWPVDQFSYLMVLCSVFLAVVIAINGVKWITNVSAGITGERMLRRLRFSLFEQVLRFPPARLGATRAGEVVQALLGEVEPLGGFIGEMVATPVSQGGMLIVFVVFIFAQDPLLGLAASAIFPVQALIIPMLQKKVVRLNRERSANNRRLADSLASAMGGVEDIRAHGTQRWHLAQVSGRLHSNTALRKALFVRKFTIKFVNNLLNHITPFLFYTIGGAMVIAGRLDLGSLVAVIAAFKELGKPWRELLTFYQRWSDFRSRFVFVVESFSGTDLAPAARVRAAPAQHLSGALALEGVEAEAHGQDVRVPHLVAGPGRSVAVSGGDAGGRLAVLRLAAGLDLPRTGAVTLGGAALAEATPADLGAAVGYLGAEPTIIEGSIRANLDYGLFRAAPPLPDTPEAREMLREGRRTGAPLHDPAGDWVDYAAAGERDAAVHRARTLALAEAAGMGGDLIVAALGTRLAEAARLGGSGRLAAARPAVIAALAAEGVETAVEPWDRAALCQNASLLENLLFALPDGAAPDTAAILERRDVARVLFRGKAEPLLVEIGTDLARAFAGLAATVSADSPLLDRVGSYGRADVLAGAALAPKLPEPGQPLRDPALRRTVVALAARYTPVRDRFDVLTPERIERLLACRAAMAGEAARLDGFAAPDAPDPPASLTIAEALLGGRRREDRRAVWRRLEAALVEAATASGLRETLLDLGLDAPAGGKGGALGPGLKARIALVRCALKRPALVVIADPALAADPAARRFLRESLPHAVMLFGADHGAILDDADAIARLDADGTVALDEAA